MPEPASPGSLKRSKIAAIDAAGIRGRAASATLLSLTTPNTYTVARNGPYWRNCVQESFTFAAGATTAVLDFSVGNQQYDMGLGEVSLNPVPVPAALALLAGGLLRLGWPRRRCRI